MFPIWTEINLSQNTSLLSQGTGVSFSGKKASKKCSRIHHCPSPNSFRKEKKNSLFHRKVLSVEFESHQFKEKLWAHECKTWTKITSLFELFFMRKMKAWATTSNFLKQQITLFLNLIAISTKTNCHQIWSLYSLLRIKSQICCWRCFLSFVSFIMTSTQLEGTTLKDKFRFCLEHESVRHFV